MRVARNRDHANFEALCGIVEAFGQDEALLLAEVHDLLREIQARGVSPLHSAFAAGRSSLRRPGRTNVPSVAVVAPTTSGRHLSSSSTTTQGSRTPAVAWVDAVETEGAAADAVWVLTSLAMVFFFFQASSSVLLLQAASLPALAMALAYAVGGMLALYELLGSKSVLGWDADVQSFALAVRDTLFAVFALFWLLELLAAAGLWHAVPAEHAQQHLRIACGHVTALTWLACLKLRLRIVSTASALGIAMAVYTSASMLALVNWRS
jgi:hypothetical protein